MKYFESIFLQRRPPDTIWHREETPECMPDGIWRMLLLKNTFKVFHISLGVVRSLP